MGTALLDALRRLRRRAVVHRVRPGVARRVRRDGRPRCSAGAERTPSDPPYWHAEVLTHERRGRDIAVFTCRPLMPFAFRAGQYVSLECQYQPRLWRTYSVANAPRADGTLEFHVRAVGAGWVSARSGAAAAGRRHHPARPADGLDDARPALHKGHRVRRRRHRAGADQGAHRGADPLQPHPLGARLLRRPRPGRPLRPGRAEPSRRPLPMAVGGRRRAARTDLSGASRATSTTSSSGTARGRTTTSSSPAPPRWSGRPSARWRASASRRCASGTTPSLAPPRCKPHPPRDSASPAARMPWLEIKLREQSRSTTRGLTVAPGPAPVGVVLDRHQAAVRRHPVRVEQPAEVVHLVRHEPGHRLGEGGDGRGRRRGPRAQPRSAAGGPPGRVRRRRTGSPRTARPGPRIRRRCAG